MFPFFVLTAVSFVIALFLLDGQVRAAEVPHEGLRATLALAPKTFVAAAILGAATVLELAYCAFW